MVSRKTKSQLIAVVIVALIAVIAAWYVTTRQTYYQYSTLVRIDYVPPPAASICSPACPTGQSCVGGGCVATTPFLTFTFSQPLAPSQVAGNTASFKSFAVGADSPTSATAAGPFTELLTKVPFAPDPQTSATVITTNTLPAGASTTAMTITGSGSMWFAVPKK